MTMQDKSVKRIIVLLVMSVITSIMYASFVLPVDNKPGFWEDYHGGDPLTNFIDPWLLRMHGFVEEPADMYGWYTNTFFTLAEWEREVCLADLSSEVRNIRNVVTDLEGVSNVYMTTITVAATKQRGFNNSKLYEVSWYVAPYGGDALYRVYLRKGDKKEFFAGRKGDEEKDWIFVSQYVGDSGYDARYLEEDYDFVVLEYKQDGSEVVNEVSVSVTKKDNMK